MTSIVAEANPIKQGLKQNFFSQSEKTFTKNANAVLLRKK